MRRLPLLSLPAVFAFAVLARAVAQAAGPPPLGEVRMVALPGVERRIDHLAVDESGQRLFVAALGNHTLEILDVAAGKRLASIPGLDEPQGVAFLPALHRIVVATRQGGTVTAFDDRDDKPVGSIDHLPDADNLRFDSVAGELYVGHGDGALGVIDPTRMKLLADIPLPGHPESFRLEEQTPRIFVNVPTKQEILIVDRAQRAIVGNIPIVGAADNYPMSLDEHGHRLFVGVRQPARLLVFDTTTSKPIASVACASDTDDLFYDAARDRVYVIGGEGYVDVFDASATGGYPRLAHLATRPGARTGLWSNDLDRLFVAWPARDRRSAAVQILGAPPHP